MRTEGRNERSLEKSYKITQKILGVTGYHLLYTKIDIFYNLNPEKEIVHFFVV